MCYKNQSLHPLFLGIFDFRIKPVIYFNIVEANPSFQVENWGALKSSRRNKDVFKGKLIIGTSGEI